ncbi:MAG: hypothetical protein K8S21_05700 [Gemmatimonadetes bacterium]|nr:hypothetical protein [Gemmatimonadota bacterium]
MTGPEILIPIFAVTFGSAFVLGPLAKAIARRIENSVPKVDAELAERIANIERNVDVIAIEVEKLAEGQRFVTKLLAERERVGGVLPSRDPGSR